jgi:hypothetical protein
MYKNVSNQLMVGLFLLYPSCFLVVTAGAQSKSAEAPTIYDLTVTKSNQNIPIDNVLTADMADSPRKPPFLKLYYASAIFSLTRNRFAL